jgi:choline dehydrogenase-like flavoprotein
VAGCAHQAGTCRFGTDPAASALNTNCRAHELNNLYVLDTSIFRSSGAVNPALAAMANALRLQTAIPAGYWCHDVITEMSDHPSLCMHNAEN